MNTSTTVGIEVRADGTQEAARDLAVVESSIRKVGKGLGEAAQYIGSAKLEKPIAGLDELAAKCNVSSRHMQNLARMMREVERERAFRQLAQDANLSTLQLVKLRAELGDTRGALATLMSGFGAAKVAVLAWTAALAIIGKAAFDAFLQLDRLQKSYKSIYGSDVGASSQLEYIYELSQRIGLQFQSTAEAAKTFFAAGQGTSLQGELNSIFEGVSSAGTALSLSQDQVQGVFLALGQMISKGKVQAEELRGQLGERLPGAFNLAARSMGITTAKLDDMLQKGQVLSEDLLPKLGRLLKDRFGKDAEEAADGAQGAVNRLSTEWERFKASVMDTDLVVKGINAVRDALHEAANALSDAEIDKKLKAANIEPEGRWNRRSKFALTGGYSDKQRDEMRRYGTSGQSNILRLLREKELKEIQADILVSRDKILEAAGVSSYLKNTKESRATKDNEAYQKAKNELQAKITEYKRQGQDISELLKQGRQIEVEHKRQQEKIAKSGNSLAQTNKQASSARYIENIRAEISKLNGEMAQSWQQKLDIKLDDIAKRGKDAGLSLSELTAITKEYAAAADAKRVRDLGDAYADLDARIAQGVGNDRLAREIQINKELEEERRKLEALAKTDGDRAKNEEYLKSLRGSLEKASTIKDAEAASDFYRELYELSGQYGLAQDEINAQLERQAENLRVNVGLTRDEVDLWLKMKELEASRDYADGITRGLMKWTGEYTNMAMQMEGFTTSTLDAMTEGLLDFTSRTSASFSDMTRSILQDLARITARMAMAGLIKTAVGFFSAPGGGTATASVSGNSISGGWAEGFMSRGSSYAAIVKHGGGMALEPSPTRRVPASFFEGAPRYHTGFINPAYERAAIIRTDESVLTPGQMKAIAGAGGASVVNNIAIVPPEGYEGKEARTANATGGEDIRVTFGRIAAQQANTYGSELNVALRRQGTRMPVMRSGG